METIQEAPMWVIVCCFSAYLGPGLTTYTHLNMGFRIYTIDADKHVQLPPMYAVHVWYDRMIEYCGTSS